MRSHRLLVTLAAAGALVVGLQSAGAGGEGLVAPTVTPASGPPGTVITISGTGCTSDIFDLGAGSADVTVTVEFVPTPVTVEITSDVGTGAWSVQVTVPADAQPGAVAVNATCQESLGEGSAGDVGPAQVTVPYPASSFTVTTGAAAPVEAAPTTTG
jgi:hypothetical protein